MNNVSTVGVILFKLLAVVIFVLPGIFISIADGNCQMSAPDVCTDQPGFAKGNWQFLVFDPLKSHWKSNFCYKELTPTGFIYCLEDGFIDGTRGIKIRDVILTQ